MSGYYSTRTEPYFAQTSAASYKITPIETDDWSIDGFPEYEIELTSMYMSPGTDTIPLWYANCAVLGDCSPGTTANKPFTITVNLPVPTVTSISPTSGPAAGGTSVTITGTNLLGATAVKFGATNATSYTVSSATSITATAPAGVGTVDVTVANGSQISATSAADQFTYIPAPTVASISPTSGPTAGGTSVTIAGTNFTGATSVKFGATNATSFTVDSATSITATAPASAAGTVDVMVTTAGGTSSTVTADQFTYIATPTATTAIASTSLTLGRAATSFKPVTGLGGTAPLSYSVSPALPNGLSMDANGFITGTPTVVRTASSFTVTVTDANSFTASASSNLTVNPAVTAGQAIASITLTQNKAMTPLTPVTGGGGTGALTYSISPSLPTGMSFNTANGTVSGTPAAANVAAVYTVTVTDTNGASASNSFTLAVNPAVTATQSVASVALTQNKEATPFTPATGSGGTGALAYSISPSLPTGMSFDTANGTVTGTPSIASVAAIYTVRVTDANSATAAATFSLTVNAAVTATQSVSSATLTANHTAQAFTPVTGAGGTSALSYAVSPSLPAGLNFNTVNGTVSGTPNASTGASVFTVTISDVNGASASNGFTLAVNPAVTAAQTVAAVTLTQNKAATSFTPVTGGGGTAPLSYSVSPSLPTGMSFDTANGTVSGTPTATLSATSFTVTVTDANSATAAATFSLTVSGAVTATQSVASATLTANHTAQAFTPVTGAGGTGALSYAVSPSLPAGLNFNTVNGTVSGTPIASIGASVFTVTISDANGASATATFNLAVNGSLAATQAVTSTALTVDHAATPFIPVTGGGGTAPLSHSVSPSLPAGMSFDSANGRVSGTPTATLPATPFTVTVTDANGATATATFSLTVNGAVTATTAIPSTILTANHAVTAFAPVAGSGGTGALSYSVSPSLPAGLSFNTATGQITGTPTATLAATTFTVTVTDVNGASASTSFALAVNGALTATQSVASTTLTADHVPVAFTPVTGGGGTGTLSYGIAPALPAGLSFSVATGEVSGLPTAQLPATTFTVTVTDINDATASATFSLTVNGAVSAAQTASSATLTLGHAAPAFTPVTGGGGTGSLSYGIAPALPAGLSFNAATGEVSGLPTAQLPATSFTVTVTDINGATASATFSLTVNGAVGATQTASSTTLTLGHAATAFAPVAGSGGTGPLTYSISPSLPAGLSFDTSTGQVTGTPTATLAATPFTVTVTDVNNASASNGFMLTVVLPTLSFMPASLPNATAGVAYSQMVVAAEGTAPYSYALTGALPDGLSFDALTGKLSGTPKAVESSNFTITATDVNSATGSITYSLTVSGPVITVVSTSDTVVTGTSATVDLTQGATGGPFTRAQLISLSPSSAGVASITLGETAAASEMVVAEIVEAGHYKLKFTAAPDFAGTAVATFTLSSAYGTSPAGTVTFIVTPRKDPSQDPDVIGLVNAQTEAAKRFATTQISNFNDHLEQLHGGDCLQNQWGLTISDSRGASQSRQDDTAQQNSGLASRNSEPHMGGAKSDPTAKADDNSTDRCSPLGGGAVAVWTGGFVNFGSMDLGASGQKFNYTTVGVSAGIDYRFSQSFTAGVGFGYGSDRSRIGDSGTQSDGSAYSVALYGSYHPTPQIFIDGLAGYGKLNFDSRRFATDTESFALGSRDGHQYFSSLTAGYEYTKDGLLISPYGRLTVSRSVLDPFTENGADWADLHYGSQSIDTFTGFLGLRLAYKIDTGWGSLEPRARVEYGHDFAGNSAATLGYADIPATSYELKALGTGNDFATFSLGTDIKVGQDLTVGTEYGTSVGQNGTQPHQIRLRISERF
ncbi:putative Ig domain-containing protein [Pseudaminobacter soli (ex Li et al. 2025)]|uniref:putative Ig domain-containing protein n=1 Tax=Pseudaminobacter soli (ex Li et al. 2025) TaxID=1295366 RepID=UPI002474C74D|nr:putative Ig domain-containing protein [Mesorhizobium soli]